MSGTAMTPVVCNDAGHKLYAWNDDAGQTWACCAYDHGPMCRRCHALDPKDDVIIGLLQNVYEGNLQIWDNDRKGWQFKMTAKGEKAAEHLLQTNEAAQTLYGTLLLKDLFNE